MKAEVIIQNQVRQSLDNVLLDYVKPNGLGIRLSKGDWSGTLIYGNNSYFIQNPALDLEVFKETHTILGKIGFFTSVNRIFGIEHYFQDNVHDKNSPEVQKKSFNYLMAEVAFLNQEFTFIKLVGFEASLRLGIIHELSGLADLTKFGRTPLKLWINIERFRLGISWDYLVHDLMEGWDVDNVKLFIWYVL